MGEYKCRCGKVFTTKFNLERHQQSDQCELNAKSKTNKKVMFKCPNPGCKCSYTREDSLKRHMKTCKYTIKKKTKKNNGTNNINGDNNTNNNLINDYSNVN